VRKLVFLFVLVLLVLSLSAQELNLGDRAIDFTAVDINGNEIKLSDFYDKVILLDFWGTWCGPCKKEIPNLIDIKNTFKNDDFEIISIALERGNYETAKRFVKDKRMNWVHVIDKPKGIELAQKYNIYFVPHVFIIKKGKIVAVHLKGSALKSKIGELVN